MAIQFGVAATPGSFGYIQNYSEDDSVQVAEALDENGDVAAINAFGRKIGVSFEYVITAVDGALPTAGTTIQADGTNYFLITNVVKTQENQGFKKMTCQGVHYTANAIPAA